MFGRLFGRKKSHPAPPTPVPSSDLSADEAAESAWYDAKSEFMSRVLGPEHDMVMHAIIPYAVGGGLDLYYFPNGVEGTAIATKELVDADRRGPANAVYPAYEWVMFTRHRLDLDAAKDAATPFGRAHGSINGILNALARFSEQATLNPGETCEFPDGFGKLSGRCLIFDGAVSIEAARAFGMGLMIALEIHRSEMDFARQHGGPALLERLRAANAHPYSDLEREPVA